MRHSWVGSAAHPPWVVSKGMGEGGATGGVSGNPTEGLRGGGGVMRSRRETALDESRKEMANRVARHQADYGVEHAYATRAANWCSWFERGLPLSFCFLLRSILCGFHFIYFFSFLLFISLMKGVVWRGWMLSLPCLYCPV